MNESIGSRSTWVLKQSMVLIMVREQLMAGQLLVVLIAQSNQSVETAAPSYAVSDDGSEETESTDAGWCY